VASLPEPGVARFALYGTPRKQGYVPIVDRVVGSFAGCDEELRVNGPFFTVLEVGHSQRVHVVDQQAAVDVIARYAEITT
jgi:hypothetical protein